MELCAPVQGTRVLSLANSGVSCSRRNIYVCGALRSPERLSSGYFGLRTAMPGSCQLAFAPAAQRLLIVAAFQLVFFKVPPWLAVVRLRRFAPSLVLWAGAGALAEFRTPSASTIRANNFRLPNPFFRTGSLISAWEPRAPLDRLQFTWTLCGASRSPFLSPQSRPPFCYCRITLTQCALHSGPPGLGL